MPTITVIQPTNISQSSEKQRVAAYCRVSSGSEEQLHSYAAQVAYYRQKFEESETETLADVYADEGVTGTREDKRDELQRLLRDCRRGKIDRIYTKSISRFSRNTRDCLKSVRELKALGITILFEKENIDTANMSDEMMITIMGGLAQEESTSISQNMRWSVQKRMENGTFKLSQAPFGYRLNDGMLEINVEEAEWVRRIFQSYLNGMGMYAIAEMLNQENCPIPQYAEKWHRNTVKYILSNERYTGSAMFRKKYRTASFPYKEVVNKGEAEQYYIQDMHPAIVELKDFERVRDMIADNAKKRNTAPVDSAFAGKIICPHCDCTYRRRQNSRTFWTCRKHYEHGSSCPSENIYEEKLKIAFLALHNKLLANFKFILLPYQTAMQELIAKQFGGNPRIMDIHRETAKLREQGHVIARLKTKGFMDDAKYAEQSATLNAKLAKLQKELQKLTKSDDEDETLKELDMLIDYFEKRQNIMTEFEEVAFAQIIDGIVVRNGDELEFRLVGGIFIIEKGI